MGYWNDTHYMGVPSSAPSSAGGIVEIKERVLNKGMSKRESKVI